MLIYLYRILSIILTPLVRIFLLIRKRKGKEDAERISERLGFTSIKRPEGKLLWIHCASVGESISMLKVARELIANFDDIHILFTSGTVTSANILKGKLPERTIHQYIPVDLYFAVKRFMKRWHPDLLLLAESEIWPNLIYQTLRVKCPIVSVNARMSEKSFKSWSRFKGTSFDFFSKFTTCIPQSQIDKDKYEALGVSEDKMPLMGNLKYDNEPLKCDNNKLDELKNVVGNRKLWLAASTHPGEEEICTNVHKKLVEKYPDLLTIIVPRHPNRIDEIVEMMESKGVKYSVRSRGEEITAETGVYVADTMGELGLFYTLSDISLVGGSMVYIKGIGGHNPIEPAQLHSAIITGPNTENFIEIYRDFLDKKACIKVDNEKGLADAIDSLLSDGVKRKELSDNAYEFVMGQSGLVANIVEEVGKVL